MSWSRPQWQTAAAVASCLLGTVLLILPSVWARIDQETPPAAANASTSARTSTSSAVPKRLQPAQAAQGSSAQGSRIPPAPDLPVASPENQAKALELARQAKALIDQYSGDTRLLGQGKVLIDAALKVDGRSAEALIEQSRFSMKYGGALSPPVLLAAETPLRHSLAYHPDHGNTLVLLGYVLTHQRRFDEAAQAFDTARRGKADSPWLELNTAEMLSLQGRNEEALDHYETAIDDPKVPVAVKDWATEQMSHLLAEMGQGGKAIAAYEKLIAAGRSKAWTYGHYSRVLRVNLIDTQRSVEMGREALKRMDYGWGRDNLGRSLYLAWAEALITEKNKAKAKQLYAEAQQYLRDPAELIFEFEYYPRAHPIFEAFRREGLSLGRLESVNSNTLLLQATHRSNGPVVKGLLQAGADPNLGSGMEGTTPLMYAAKTGNAALVRILLDGGAEPRLCDMHGSDAEAQARSAGHPSVAESIAESKRKHPPQPWVLTGIDSEGMPLLGFRYRLLQASNSNGLPLAKGTEMKYRLFNFYIPGQYSLEFATRNFRSVTVEHTPGSREWTRTFEFVGEPVATELPPGVPRSPPAPPPQR